MRWRCRIFLRSSTSKTRPSEGGPASTGRWANAFLGNGSLEIDKGHEIVELRKRVEELERENELLKNFRAFLNQGHARGTGSSRRIGASSVPSGAANSIAQVCGPTQAIC